MEARRHLDLPCHEDSTPLPQQRRLTRLGARVTGWSEVTTSPQRTFKLGEIAWPFGENSAESGLTVWGRAWSSSGDLGSRSPGTVVGRWVFPRQHTRYASDSGREESINRNRPTALRSRCRQQSPAGSQSMGPCLASEPAPVGTPQAGCRVVGEVRENAGELRRVPIS